MLDTSLKHCAAFDSLAHQSQLCFCHSFQISSTLVCQYHLEGYFFFDLIATIPFSYILSSTSGSLIANKLGKLGRLPRMVRFLKAVRLLKLLRVYKVRVCWILNEIALALDASLSLPNQLIILSDTTYEVKRLCLEARNRI